jgi:hypothetical protein
MAAQAGAYEQLPEQEIINIGCYLARVSSNTKFENAKTACQNVAGELMERKFKKGDTVIKCTLLPGDKPFSIKGREAGG